MMAFVTDLEHVTAEIRARAESIFPTSLLLYMSTATIKCGRLASSCFCFRTILHVMPLHRILSKFPKGMIDDLSYEGKSAPI